MSQRYENEFKKKIIRLHLNEGRSLKSLEHEYGVSHGTIANWCRKYREECQENKEKEEEYDLMKENLRLRKELAEQKKENDFLKKAAAFFAKEID